MLLAIDVGNTQMHLGVWDREVLVHEWRAATDPRRTADELALMCGEFLSLADLSFSRQITGVVVASVVPRATQELREMTSRYFGFSAMVVDDRLATGLVLAVENPHEVGADRIANAVASQSLFSGEAVIIVDFGTAITVDAVSAKGEYLGGAIAPGIETAAGALFSSTAQIRRVELVAPEHAIGRSTVAGVQSGIIFGAAALADGLVERIMKELGGDARVVATGGFAAPVAEHCHRIERIEPCLTLIGLRLIFGRNLESAG